MSAEQTEAALSGLRVLEMADESGSWCGRLLAGMGAEVVKIEPPGGDRCRFQPPFWADQAGAQRSLAFLYMNAGKKSICLDLATESGRRRLRELALCADVLIETLPPGRLAELGCSYDELRVGNPGLILTSISGFGQNGPHSGFKSTDIVAAAMSGAMAVTGHADDPPVRLAGTQSYYVASTLAAAGTLIALHHRRCTGRGQQIDISLQEAMLSVSSICGVAKWLEDGLVPRRFGTGLFAAVPSGTYPCRDGQVYLIVNRPKHWQVLARWVHEVTGNREILDPMFEGPSSARQPYRELLDLYLGELTSQFSVEAFYREGQRRHLAVTPLSTAASLAGDRHLNARQFFVDVEHPGQGRLRYPGPPCRLSATPWQTGSAAPAPGQHDAELDKLLRRWHARAMKPIEECVLPSGGALSGLRVVEFTAGMAGPWVGRFLAWCGADVIKVESQNYPDVTRLYVSPKAPEAGVQPESSPWFTDWNAGKRFVALNLHKPEATALARRLIQRSDIVIDNNAFGVLEKLGLGFDELAASQPQLILLSSTGYGRTGPDAHYISWGPNIETLSGLSGLSGFPGRACTMTQYAYPDALSALYGLFAALCAQEYRARTGAGQSISVSQTEATVASMGHVLLELLANHREPPRRGNGSPSRSPEGCYPCAGEDRWCVLSVDGEVEWAALCTVLGPAAWSADSRFATVEGRLAHRDELDLRIARQTVAWEAWELMARLQRAGIAAGVVQDVEDQYRRDGHLRERRYFEAIPHLKKGRVVAPGIPLGLSDTPGATRDSGRSLGYDNRAVFCDLLGLSEREYSTYVEAGVIEDGSGSNQATPASPQ